MTDVTTELTRLAQSVERDGEERIGMTLLVGGSVVTGHLSPMSRFDWWLRTYENRLSQTASMSDFGSVEARPALLDALDYRNERRGKPENPDGPTALCLRNVVIAGAHPEVRRSFILVTIADVSGFSLAEMPSEP